MRFEVKSVQQLSLGFHLLSSSSVPEGSPSVPYYQGRLEMGRVPETPPMGPSWLSPQQRLALVSSAHTAFGI